MTASAETTSIVGVNLSEKPIDYSRIDYSEKLPFFVYGTLRVGRGNYEWTGLRAAQSGYEIGVRAEKMVMVAPSRVPFSFQGSIEDYVVGDLIYVPDEVYAETCRCLDALESFRLDNVARSWYKRVPVVVTRSQGLEPHIRAWMYIIDDPDRRDEMINTVGICRDYDDKFGPPANR